MIARNDELGLIIYGDGSARPNPGFIGSGVHGYYYKLDDNSGKSNKLGDYFTTDKGYQKRKASANDNLNGEVTGLPVKPVEYIELAVPYNGISTNNHAELGAILHGLRKAYKEEVKAINIICDSEYTLNVIRRDMNTWANNNWTTSTGKQVSNLNTVKELYTLLTSIKDSGVKISASWVRGHSDIAGNTQADMLSNIARSLSMVEAYDVKVNTYTSNQYTDPKIDKHPLLSHRRIYFISKEEQNSKGFYFQGESGAGDFMIGKRLPETGYSVLMLNSPESLIETVKDIQYKYATGITQICSLLVDTIYSKQVYNYLNNFGIHATEKDKRNNSVNFLDGKPLTMVMNPTGLSIRAIDCFNTLSDILNIYVKNRDIIETTEIDAYRYTVRNITEMFFDISKKTHNKQEFDVYNLKKEFVTGIKNIVLDHTVTCNGDTKTLKIPIIFGTDLPDRNHIKRLEKLHPKIKLITWRYSEEVINYSIIIEADDSVGIWSNFYSDQIVIV